MTDTLPGELRWELWHLRWYVRCETCDECWGLPRWYAVDHDEDAAEHVTGRGWRCVAGRWVCPGCAGPAAGRL